MEAAHFALGVLIGIVFGVPAGAVGALTVRRTVEHGRLAGLASGLGCSAADALYAAASAFGFSFVSQAAASYQNAIGVVGGLVLVVLGVCVARQRPVPAHAERAEANLPALFCSSFAIAASNPSTVLMFLFAFALFGVDVGGVLDGALLVAGVTLGTCCWWVLLVQVVGRLRTRITRTSMRAFNRACGAFVAAFGCVAAVRPFFS